MLTSVSISAGTLEVVLRCRHPAGPCQKTPPYARAAHALFTFPSPPINVAETTASCPRKRRTLLDHSSRRTLMNPEGMKIDSELTMTWTELRVERGVLESLRMSRLKLVLDRDADDMWNLLGQTQCSDGSSDMPAIELFGDVCHIFSIELPLLLRYAMHTGMAINYVHKNPLPISGFDIFSSSSSSSPPSFTLEGKFIFRWVWTVASVNWSAIGRARLRSPRANSGHH